MKEWILETKKLTKKIRNKTVVKGIDLKVRAGAVYGLLGPNGAGKSSTLKMLTGIWHPTSGEILFDRHRWSRKDLARISALIETPPLYGNLTARENLLVKTTLLGLPQSRIGEVLEQVELHDTGRKTAREFSLGMKQRLGIALALVNEPELLILDEPTNGLDPIGIQELRALIRSLTQQGIGVILSSHILSEVEQVADDVGIIVNGILGYQGRAGQGEDLEELFMSVVQSCGREAC